MHRRNGHTLPADDEASLKLSIAMSAALRTLLTNTSYTQSGFAAAIGYSRVTLNQVLKSTDGRYLWRLPLICAVSRVLGIKVSEFIRAAEDGASGSVDGVIELARRVKSPVPDKLVERLRDLVRRVLNLHSSFPGDPANAPCVNDGYELIYHCSVEEIEHGAPGFFHDYLSGTLSERDAFKRVWDAFDYVLDHGGPAKMPFWAALKTVYK